MRVKIVFARLAPSRKASRNAEQICVWRASRRSRQIPQAVRKFGLKYRSKCIVGPPICSISERQPNHERLALVSTRNVSRWPILLPPRYSLTPLARNESRSLPVRNPNAPAGGGGGLGALTKRSPVAGAEQEIVVIELVIQTDEAGPPPTLSAPPCSSPSGIQPGFWTGSRCCWRGFCPPPPCCWPPCCFCWSRACFTRRLFCT
jgi:hypothetical protein